VTSEIPLPTRDPLGFGNIVVTRIEVPETGVVIEGNFSLGWIGRLTREQLDFVGLLLERRNNAQRLANDLGLAYNTVRARFEEVVHAIGGVADDDRAARRRHILEQLASGEVDVDGAHAALRDLRPRS
jgi:hypothetical protein